MTAHDILHPLEKFDNLRILCVGDIMLDRFIYGTVDRISPEGPIPIFNQNREEKMLGGAGNVVRNLLSLGILASFVSVVGDDAVGNQLTGLVGKELKLLPHLISERGRISAIKTRYVASGQQLLRSDHESKSAISAETISKLLETAQSELDGQHAVILSDYGKGALTPQVCKTIIAAAKAKNIPTFVDPKSRDFSIYAGATVLSPNLKELAMAFGLDSFVDDHAIIGAAKALCVAHQFEYLLVTRGEQGMTLVNAQGLLIHIPAQAVEVFDVSGAGDTVIATLAASFAGGASMAQAAELANLAAGVVVGRLGTATVYRADITSAYYQHRAASLQQKILPLEHAIAQADRWRREGQKIGFTNGCFDILHSGHVSLLTDAAKHCDRLIIGLNTDASVRGLKGPSRPVNHELDRAHILAALEVVDAVVLFGEETPIELIKSLRPDVLMKGADYTREQVVGHEIVESYGGKVELIALKEGYSTTGLIKKLATQ